MSVVLTTLSAGLQERRDHYTEIFGVALDDGFAMQDDFVTWPVDQKYEIKRKILSSLTQPGKTNAVNNKGSFIEVKSTVGELAPGKVDIKFDEDDIEDVNNSFMQEVGSSDPNDIFSIAGYDWIIENVFSQTGSEVAASLYRSSLGFGYDNTNATTQATSRFQGGLNLIDGLEAKFDDAITAGSILSTQVVTKTAVTASNILAELDKIFIKINSFDYIRREMNNPRMGRIGYSIYVPTEWEALIVQALEALPYKDSKTVRLQDGSYVPTILKRTKLKFRSWMDGTGEAFFSPDDNLFFLTKKGVTGNSARSVCSFEAQKVARDLQLLIDWKYDVNFADPRFLVLYK
jgi:hypothetical protein